LLKKLRPKSEFSRNVLTLMTGTTIAQAIPIAITPILTRIYTPEDFGLFALYMGIASIISVIATGRYELAVMLPKKDTDAIQIVYLSLIVTICMGLFSLFIVYYFNAKIASLLASEDIANWLYLTPISVFFSGVYQTFNYWFNRQRQYNVLGQNRIVQNSTTAVINLGAGFTNIGVGGLIWGYIFGQIVAVIYMIYLFLKDKLGDLGSLNKLKIIALGKQYIGHIKYNSLSALIDTFRVNGIYILLNKLFSGEILGFYFLSYKVLQLPMGLVGSSISQVFFQKISRESKLYELTKKFVFRMFFIASIPLGIIFIFGEEIFTFVFGEHWAIAGEISRILVPWIILSFVASPLASIYIKLDKLKLLLGLSSTYFLMSIVSIIIGYIYVEDILKTLIIFSMLNSIFLLIYILITLGMLKKEIK